MRMILTLIMCVMLAACAKPGETTTINNSNPSNPTQPKSLTCADYGGLYDNRIHTGNTLTIQNDCTFTDSICGYTASFTLPSNDETQITVVNTNGTPGCMSNSVHNCIVSYNGDDLAVVCEDTIQNNQHTMSFDKR